MNRVVIKMQNVKLTRFSRVVEMELEWNEMEQVRDNKVDMLSEDNEYEELTDWQSNKTVTTLKYWIKGECFRVQSYRKYLYAGESIRP